jgi:branched-chain amino acid transport system substrate-binding protein
MFSMTRRAVSRASFVILLAGLPWAAAPVRAADPIKIGFSMALTGAVAPNGKQNLLALEIWRDDVNAKGGLMGRAIELVYYDDQSNPNNVPGIYTKLISVDKVDLLLAPYATNMIAPAMPVIIQAKKMTISMLGVNINR